MKASIGTLCHFFNTHRMVSEYTERFYLPAHERFRLLEAEGDAQARSLAAFIGRVQAGWPQVRIEAVEDGPGQALPVGTLMRARAHIRLGALMPEDVAVELYLGRLDPSGEIVDAESALMKPVGRDADGRHLFEAEGVPCSRSGLHGFTVRVRPHHPYLAAAGGGIPFLPGLIAWAEPERAGASAGKG